MMSVRAHEDVIQAGKKEVNKIESALRLYLSKKTRLSLIKADNRIENVCLLYGAKTMRFRPMKRDNRIQGM